jgi:hypothetical protein
MIELPGKPPNNTLVPGIGKTKAPRGQSAQMDIRGYDYYGFSGTLGFHCGGYGRGSASIDNDIGLIVIYRFVLISATR